MKIIVLQPAEENNNLSSTALNIMDVCPRLWMKADSALLKNGKPFFIPDFTGECTARLYLAVRICRMGKSIPGRYAYRYYDAFGVGIDFTAEDVLRTLREQGEPWDKAKSFDMSAAVGDFVPVESMAENGADCGPMAPVSLSLLIDGKEASATRIPDVRNMLAKSIEEVSKLFTLRQGDILFLGNPDRAPRVEVNQHVDGVMNGRVVTRFNIK